MSSAFGAVCSREAFLHGKCYWGVLLTSGKEVLFYADRLTFGDDGSLVARSERKRDIDPEVLFAVSPGQWILAYSADLTTGKPTSVARWGSARQHWKADP